MLFDFSRIKFEFSDHSSDWVIRRVLELNNLNYTLHILMMSIFSKIELAKFLTCTGTLLSLNDFWLIDHTKKEVSMKWESFITNGHRLRWDSNCDPCQKANNTSFNYTKNLWSQPSWTASWYYWMLGIHLHKNWKLWFWQATIERIHALCSLSVLNQVVSWICCCSHKRNFILISSFYLFHSLPSRVGLACISLCIFNKQNLLTSKTKPWAKFCSIAQVWRHLML